MKCVVFPARIKALRKQKGLTQAALGADSGVSADCICKYEGYNNFPSGIESIEKIARGLHTDPAYLVGWRDEPWKGCKPWQE